MRVKQAERKRMMVVKKKVSGGSEADTDQESVGSSSEEMGSPRSVLLAPKTKSKSGRNSYKTSTAEKNIGEGLYLHSQIVRIRDEDSHIGEEIDAEVLLNFCVANKPEVDSLMLLSRPAVLPASPLSGKTETTAIKAAD